jgi:hypothetical protein
MIHGVDGDLVPIGKRLMLNIVSHIHFFFLARLKMSIKFKGSRIME